MKTHKPRTHVSVAALSDDDLLVHLRAANIWDAISLDADWNQSQRLLLNANIGNLSLTNMQVAGQIAGDQSMVVMNWYARTNINRTPLFERFAALTYVTLIIGNVPTWCSPISDLITPSPGQRQRAPIWPTVIPHRQNISLQLDTFGRAADPLVNPIDRQRDIGLIDRPLVWIHLEGMLIPRSLWIRDDEDEDATEIRRRWTQLQAKVLRLVTSARSQQVDTAEHIARWLASMSEDPTINHDIRSQLDALADGIREGRWRPEDAKPPTPGT
jgi:hypothetical protein